MEASERPQLPLDHADEGTVRVLGDRLVIEHLTVADERAARVVRLRAEAGQHPAETLTKAVEIGARVLDSEETAVNVDYVQAALERGVGKVSQELSAQADAAIETLGERIAISFGPERADSVQAQIKEIVAKASEEQRVAIGRLFSSEDGANPLTDFKAAVVRGMKELDARRERARESDRAKLEELTSEVVTLRERLSTKDQLAAEQARGTAKGLSFEERVHEAIARIASVRGDCASHTGMQAAEGGGKKGDTLVELGAADGPATGRLLFEAKDKKLSQNDAWRELNDGMAVRAAAFGVLVVAGEERVPARTDALVEYQGNKLIVPVDREEPDGLALEVAYRLAAARVAMARDRDLRVDALEVRDTASEALSILKQAQAIKTTLSHINTSSEKARTGLDEMVESVRLKLERIESLVAEAKSP